MHSTNGSDWRERTELLIGGSGLENLARARVVVVGLGGVGSYCAEALARAGVGSLVLVDGDSVSVSNINRQIIALVDTIGLPKAQVMADRIGRINPACAASPQVMWVSRDNADRLLSPERGSVYYVADAIDSIPAKLDLIEACLKSGVNIISSMGAGNKIDPTRFRVADISQTHTCPVARAVRQGLRKRGILRGLTVVFSDESPIVHQPGPVGSISPVPGAAGLAMAGAIIRSLVSAPAES
jgi:tRNA A37 threonylcarbamoyladenosine dehydratase